jgi:hypothetical protein
VYGTRKRHFSGPDAAALALDVPAPTRTGPALRMIPARTGPDSAAPLPGVTAELFIQAAAIATQRVRGNGAELLRRGLEQAACCTQASRAVEEVGV